MFLTPKPSFIPEPPQNRPYVGAIVGSNLLCFILHLCYDRPAASEATRGYLHGGLAMDFIGQKGPTSKLHLVMLDILILALQLVALGAHITRLKVKKQSTTPVITAPSQPVDATTASVEPGQDLNHEEQGLHRSDHHPVDVELEILNSSGRRNPPDQSSASQQDVAEESEALLGSAMQPRSDAHIFDAFNSGEIMILDLDVTHLVTSQVEEYSSAPYETPATAPGRSLSERLARGGLGFRLQVGERVLGV